MARIAVLLLLGLGWSPAPAAAQPLVFDLSSHLIAITTGFAGTEVLLYGAVTCDIPCEVAVVVRGPRAPTTVWRKGRIGAIWVNRESITFKDVPSYYRVAASLPLYQVATAVRQRHQLGIDVMEFEPVSPARPPDLAEFRAGLVRGKIRDGLFAAEPGLVSFLGGRTLFRTRLFLPANVPTGSYAVEVFLLQQGEVTAAQNIPMLVSKAGLGAEVFEFAHRYSALYGIVAILISVAAGWAAGVAFRKS